MGVRWMLIAFGNANRFARCCACRSQLVRGRLVDNGMLTAFCTTAFPNRHRRQPNSTSRMGQALCEYPATARARGRIGLEPGLDRTVAVQHGRWSRPPKCLPSCSRLLRRQLAAQIHRDRASLHNGSPPRRTNQFGDSQPKILCRQLGNRAQTRLQPQPPIREPLADGAGVDRAGADFTPLADVASLAAAESNVSCDCTSNCSSAPSNSGAMPLRPSAKARAAGAVMGIDRNSASRSTIASRVAAAGAISGTVKPAANRLQRSGEQIDDSFRRGVRRDNDLSPLIDDGVERMDQFLLSNAASLQLRQILDHQ